MYQPLPGGFYTNGAVLAHMPMTASVPHQRTDHLREMAITPTPSSMSAHSQAHHQQLNNGGHYASVASLRQVALSASAPSLMAPPPPPPLPLGSGHRSHSTQQRPKSKSRSRRRDKSEISLCLKYVIFGSNVVFWVFGLCIMLAGFWAWNEKDIFNNFSRITNLALDPAFVLIVAGCVGFTIGFTGCVGALRENTWLLAGYAIFLALLLLLEMTVGILGFIFKDWIKTQATHGFQAFITSYRDDPDRQNLIDWIQEQWLECCGIEGPKDWDMNIYFNCSSIAQGSREACGVPFSCCRNSQDDLIQNKQCGYGVRKPTYAGDKSAVIFEKGCLRSGEEWIEANLVPVAGFSVTIAVLQNGVSIEKRIFTRGCVPAAKAWVRRNLLSLVYFVLTIILAQILGICFAQNLRADIFAQRAKWQQH